MSPHAAAITLCAAAAAGVFLIALADRLRVPSIAILLAGGIALGPEALAWIDPHSLGSGLETVVTVAVAVILFEGGLTLDVVGFRREPQVIIRMLTIGVLVTWVGSAAAIYFAFGVTGELAIMAGSLVIVTGPTVVSPILRRIGVQPRLHHILYWEGVMVDAMGVFIAVLCYEWIAARADQSPLAPLGRFAFRFVIGAGVGTSIGLLLGFVLRRQWVEAEHTNIIVLGSALLALAVANTMLAESGILAVIVAGLVLSLRRAPQLRQLKRFKLDLTELSIGLLFVLLAARLDLDAFGVDGFRLLAVLAVIVLVLRPLNVLLSTWGQGFDWRERAFLSWLAPRGIVAASMASLFALRLSRLGHADAALLETVTYAVIGTTVVLQGLSAPQLAKWLRVKRRSHGSWLLIGDPELAVALHRQLRQAGAPSLVLAADPSAIDESTDDSTVISNPLQPSALTDQRIGDVEAVLALALDPDVNDQICQAWSTVVGPSATYRWDGQDVTPAPGRGRPIWTDVAPPAHVKVGLAERTCALETVDVGTPEDTRRFGPAVQPLLTITDGRISLVEEQVVEPRTAVILRQRTPGLYGLFRDAVVIDRHNSTFEETVTALLERASLTSPGLATETHLAEILDRERTMPTSVGCGVAIPHVYDDSAEHSSCYVANVVSGLNLRGPDNKPVHLVFLVVSPSGKATEHLRSLAAIAHLASDSDLIEVLSRQRVRGRILALLSEHE